MSGWSTLLAWLVHKDKLNGGTTNELDSNSLVVLTNRLILDLEYSDTPLLLL